MYLKEAQIRNYRCLRCVNLEFDPQLNLIIGENASGKTSLLEALYGLGRGKSFRTPISDRLIRSGTDSFSVFARLETQSGGANTVGISHTRGGTRFQLEGNKGVTILDLVRTLPIQIIDPGIHRLSEEGPGQRRRFLDWGVFHVEHDFYFYWNRYRRALKQRNKALKQPGAARLASAWHDELTSAGHWLDTYRCNHVKALQTVVPSLCKKVLADRNIGISYYRGWSANLSLGDALAEGLKGDVEVGYTRAGPHRADLRLKLEDTPARDRASRGEQKAITILLSLAQTKVMLENTGIAPIILIDDLIAELGHFIRKTIGDIVSELKAQCFVTFLDQALVAETFEHGRMFHVEQGAITPMI